MYNRSGVGVRDIFGKGRTLLDEVRRNGWYREEDLVREVKNGKWISV